MTGLSSHLQGNRLLLLWLLLWLLLLLLLLQQQLECPMPASLLLRQAVNLTLADSSRLPYTCHHTLSMTLTLLSGSSRGDRGGGPCHTHASIALARD